jgi:hypothetical protein
MVEMKPQFLGLSSLYPNCYTSYTILVCEASYCETEKVIRVVLTTGVDLSPLGYDTILLIIC